MKLLTRAITLKLYHGDQEIWSEDFDPRLEDAPEMVWMLYRWCQNHPGWTAWHTMRGPLLWRGKNGRKPEDDEALVAKLRRQEERDRKREQQEMKREARAIEKALQRRLTNLGLYYMPKNARRPSQVRFRACYIPSDGGQLWMQLARPPHRIRLAQLLDEEICELDLPSEIGCSVRPFFDKALGGFYIINRGSGAAGLPRFFPWYDPETSVNVLDNLPKSNTYTVAMGLSYNRAIITADVTRWPHVLGGGATDQGKSSWVRQALCTLIKRNPPSRVKFLLMDFKSGLELGEFESIPHLIQNGFVEDIEDAEETLQQITAIMDRRMAKLKEAGVRDIRGWNYGHRHNKMSRLFVVIDELQDLMYEPRIKSKVEALVRTVARKGRAAGIYLWMFTQTPNKEVVTRSIKGNISARLAFGCPDNQSSMLIIDTGAASRLDPVPGRAIYRFGRDRCELQSPWITSAQVSEVVADAIGGRDTGIAALAVPAEEIWRYVLENLGGRAPYTEIFQHFRDRVGRAYIQRVLRDNQYDASRQSPVIQIGFDNYILLPAVSGGAKSRPRRLYLVDGILPDSDRLAQLQSHH